MALFGGIRDAKFLASINSELLNAIVDTEIEFYKLIVDANQYFTGKNPETWPNGSQHGYSVSVLCDAHATRQTPLGIKNIRRGGNNISPAYKGH